MLRVNFSHDFKICIKQAIDASVQAYDIIILLPWTQHHGSYYMYTCMSPNILLYNISDSKPISFLKCC